jgi:hypothetical protein
MSIKKNKVLSLSDFVDQGPVIDRMMEVFGAKDWTEMSASCGLTYQAVRYYAKNERGIGWDLIFKCLGKTDKGLDWLIFGKEKNGGNNGAIIPLPVARNAKAVVDWVESKGDMAKDYDSGVKIAVAEKYPEFLRWQKKTEEQEKMAWGNHLSNLVP